MEVFQDGLSLYQQILKDPPACLISDIILPNLTGLAVARLLKFHDRFKTLPILMVSSITDADIEQQALAVGANAFLSKPLKKAELQSKVSELLGNGQTG